MTINWYIYCLNLKVLSIEVSVEGLHLRKRRRSSANSAWRSCKSSCPTIIANSAHSSISAPFFKSFNYCQSRQGLIWKIFPMAQWTILILIRKRRNQRTAVMEKAQVCRAIATCTQHIFPSLRCCGYSLCPWQLGSKSLTTVRSGALALIFSYRFGVGWIFLKISEPHSLRKTYRLT